MLPCCTCWIPWAWRGIQQTVSQTPHWPYNLLPGALVPISTGARGRAVHWRLTVSSLIQSSSHALGAGVFFIQKKICSIRPCIDYWSFSYITSKNKPSPFSPSWLHRAWIISNLDLQDAYHLVWIHQGDEWKTAFNTLLGHSEYLVINTLRSTVFHLEVSNVLRDMLNRFILLFSETREERIQHVHPILQHLLESKLFVKAEKYKFHLMSVSFLGFVVKRGQLSPDPAMVSAVAERPTPSSRMHLQCFLGFVSFYLCFIWDYSKVVAPLTAT